MEVIGIEELRLGPQLELNWIVGPIRKMNSNHGSHLKASPSAKSGTPDPPAGAPGLHRTQILKLKNSKVDQHGSRTGELDGDGGRLIAAER